MLEVSKQHTFPPRQRHNDPVDRHMLSLRVGVRWIHRLANVLYVSS